MYLTLVQFNYRVYVNALLNKLQEREKKSIPRPILLERYSVSVEKIPIICVEGYQ